MMAMFAQTALTVLLLGGMFFCWAMVHEIMAPWMLQKQRESRCAHAYEEREHAPHGGVAFISKFCPKCGSVRIIAAGESMGVVKRPVPQKQAAKRAKQRAGT